MNVLRSSSFSLAHTHTHMNLKWPVKCVTSFSMYSCSFACPNTCPHKNPFKWQNRQQLCWWVLCSSGNKSKLIFGLNISFVDLCHLVAIGNPVFIYSNSYRRSAYLNQISLIAHIPKVGGWMFILVDSIMFHVLSLPAHTFSCIYGELWPILVCYMWWIK